MFLKSLIYYTFTNISYKSYADSSLRSGWRWVGNHQILWEWIRLRGHSRSTQPLHFPRILRQLRLEPTASRWWALADRVVCPPESASEAAGTRGSWGAGWSLEAQSRARLLARWRADEVQSYRAFSHSLCRTYVLRWHLHRQRQRLRGCRGSGWILGPATAANERTRIEPIHRVPGLEFHVQTKSTNLFQ